MIKFLKNKITSPENSKYYLFKMNEPALTARQHAAYDRCISIFTNNLFSYSATQRSKIYETVLKLLSIVIQARNSLPIKTTEEEKDPITQYLLLLKDTIKAAHALVAHEMILFREEKELSSLIGSDISLQIRSTDEVFTNSELNIYHCANDLIELATPSITRLRDRQLKNFSQEDTIRYKKTLKEFKSLYSMYAKDIDEKL